MVQQQFGIYDSGSHLSGDNKSLSSSLHMNVKSIFAETIIEYDHFFPTGLSLSSSLRFRDPAGRLRPSSVAWLPNQATQVVVAYDDDTNPSFQMWDLRNSSFPFKEFPGHTRGIVDIQFCDLDPLLMVRGYI